MYLSMVLKQKARREAQLLRSSESGNSSRVCELPEQLLGTRRTQDTQLAIRGSEKQHDNTEMTRHEDTAEPLILRLRDRGNMTQHFLNPFNHPNV